MGLFDRILRDVAQAADIAAAVGTELIEKGKNSDLARSFDEEAARKAMKRGEELGTKLGDHLAAIFEVVSEGLQQEFEAHDAEEPSAPPPQATVAEATPEAVAESKPKAEKKPAAKKPAAKKPAAKRASTRKPKA